MYVALVYYSVLTSFRLSGLPHINFKLVDFLYDDPYFQRSSANFWDVANPTDFDTYLHCRLFM